MKEKNLEMLEFPRIREILSRYASFALSHELVMGLKPSISADTVKKMLEQSGEAMHLLSLQPDLTIGGVMDVREPVVLAERGMKLDLESLANIQRTLTNMRLLSVKLRNLAEEAPILSGIASAIAPLPGIEKEIARCISPTAELLDTASDRLAEIRMLLKDKRQQILHKLDALIKSRETEKYIQDPIITEREGRYVIPVKVETRREFRGIVHDISNTGATAFVEPLVTIDLGNELRELVIEEQHEIDRILMALSESVGRNEEIISQNLKVVAEIDLILAKARFGERYHAVVPVISGLKKTHGVADSDKRVIRLINARHPLLKGKPVPLNIEMGTGFTGLIVTGPNTGGKTVALKTIGLLSLMAQSGIPIPASHESCVPIFDNIFADIGDEQSIEQTLSTFSSHMGNIVRILKDATDKSLVLLDELGTSTDPGEGAALAQSILLYFLNKGVMFVATTHFSELKAFAHGTPGLQNASLDFDPLTHAPTYHLTVGIPGGSNALAIALQLGLPPEVIDNARDRLSRSSIEIEALLSDLQLEKQKLESLQVDLRQEKETAERLRRELDEEKAKFKEQEEQLLGEMRTKLVRDGDELQRQIRDSLSELKKTQSREKIEQAQRALSEMRKQLNSKVWQPKNIGTAAQSEDKYAVGQKVLIRDMNAVGTIAALPDSGGQIEILLGKTRLKISPEMIEKFEGKTSPSMSYALPSRGYTGKVVSRELDLRGKRADEVEYLLDQYLDDAGMSNLPEVRIVHGYGTGTVRQIVRHFLAGHRLVSSFRSGRKEEGGDGVTVVSL